MRTQEFHEGDLVSVQIPAKDGVGPIGMSGIVREIAARALYVESDHTRHCYWRAREHCKLIKAGWGA